MKFKKLEKKLMLILLFIAIKNNNLEAKVLSKKNAIELFYCIEVIKEIAYRKNRSANQQKTIFLQNKSVLLKKLNISDQDFMETFKYYLARPTDFLEIYNEVLLKFNGNGK